MCAIGAVRGIAKERMVVGYKIFKVLGKQLLPQYARSITYDPGGYVFQARDGYDHGFGRLLQPARRNKVGFYAFEKLEDARNDIRSRNYLGTCTIRKVKLFGKIIRHRTGYRGEFMQILGKA